MTPGSGNRSRYVLTWGRESLPESQVLEGNRRSGAAMADLVQSSRVLAQRVMVLARGEALVALILVPGQLMTLKSHGQVDLLPLPLLLLGAALRLALAAGRLRRILATTDDGGPALSALLLELAAQAAESAVLVLGLVLLSGGTGESFLWGMLAVDWAVFLLRVLAAPGLSASARWLNLGILARMTCFMTAGLMLAALGGSAILGVLLLVIVLKEWACTRRLNRFKGSVEPQELAAALGHLSDLVTLQGVLFLFLAVVGGLLAGLYWALLTFWNPH